MCIPYKDSDYEDFGCLTAIPTEFEQDQGNTDDLQTKGIKSKEEVQVTEKCELEATIPQAEQTQDQDEKRKSPPGPAHDNRKRSRNSKHRPKRCSVKKAMLIVFLSTFGQSLQCSPTVTVETVPVVFGTNVKLKCACTSDNFATIHWLKGSNKQYITAGNSSIFPTKYSTSLYHDEGENIYYLTIEKFSLTDLDLYVCEFGFHSGLITLSLNENMIYLPMGDDISTYITRKQASDSTTVDIHLKIDRIYPEPNCTASYKGNEISNAANISTDRISSLYILAINVRSVGCKGVLSVNCVVSLRTFDVHEMVDKCSTENKIQITETVLVCFGIIIAVALPSLLIVFLCLKYSSRLKNIRHLPTIFYKKLGMVD